MIKAEVQIIDGPLDRVYHSDWHFKDAGAVIMFEGIVRLLEGNNLISALKYEAYEPMAGKMLTEIGNAIIIKHNLTAMKVFHSTGLVSVGECSFRMFVAAEHRAEAITAMTEFIDLMKQDVPIWKTSVPGK